MGYKKTQNEAAACSFQIDRSVQTGWVECVKKDRNEIISVDDHRVWLYIRVSLNLLLIDRKSFWIVCWLLCAHWIWNFVISFSLALVTGHPLHVFVCWGLTSLFKRWGHILTVPACSSGTLTNLLPHRNAMPQTQDMTPHPVTVYRHGANLSLCYPSVCVCSHHYFYVMKVLHNAGSLWSCIITMQK